jgi:Icc-related predicted phosphoesterase
MSVRLVCLSDTHNLHERVQVPDGDILVHAGDFTSRGTVREVEAFGQFLARQPHRAKVVVAGNHDFLFQRDPERARQLLGDVHYLEDSAAEVAGLRIWGSPWQPWFHDWAFNLPRGGALAAKWALVPDALDVLVTHTPPHRALDRTQDGSEVGCEELTSALARVRPRLHVFGHIHEAHGHASANGTLLVNACICDLRYRAVQNPVVIDWDGSTMRVVEA